MHYVRARVTLWLVSVVSEVGVNDIIIILIVTVESDTVKYHEFIAAYCYECAARVTMLEAMNE